jgi:hypothetical protein
MLSPLDYRDDCEAMLGRLLSHDAQVDVTELADAFEHTKSKWHDSYGTPYVYRPPPDCRRARAECGGGLEGGYSPHRSTAYAGCGSCGWGDADFHAQLDHPQEEARQIEHAYDGGGGGGVFDGAAVLTSDVTVSEGKEVSEAWASDAPLHAASGSGDEGVMSDPCAVPASVQASSVDDDGGSWGWDYGGGDWGDWGGGGGDGGDCGGGCGGD